MKKLLSIAIIFTLLLSTMTSTFSTAKETVKILRLEAETATFTGNAKTYDYPAASKGKVAAFLMKTGDSATFLNLPKGNGLTIGYTKGASGLGKMSLYINNVHTQDLIFKNTGGWGTTAAEYKTAQVALPIPKGATVKFQIDSDDIAVNLDYIDVYTSGKPPVVPAASTSPIQRVEGEDTLMQGGAIAYDYPLASNAKVAAYIMYNGDAITVPNAPKAKGLIIGYTNGTINRGKLSLYINGKHTQDIAFPITSGFGNVASDYQKVNLSIAIPAAASVKLQFDGGDQPVNIDYMDFYTQTQPPVMVQAPVVVPVPKVTKEPLGHTISDIRKEWRASQEINTEKAIVETPIVSAPYAPGKLSAGFLGDGLRMANFMRYLANLPNDLVLSDALNNQAQYGAVLNAATGALNHYPEKPADMPQNFYDIGRSSTSSSNLAQSIFSLSNSVVSYMDDSDPGNVSKVGHRRWILNPALKQIGFGLANGYSTMQIMDASRTTAYDYDMVCWPSKGNFPVEYFSGVLSTLYKPTAFQKQSYAADAGNQAWSVSLNPTKYQAPILANLQVEVRRLPDNYRWKLNGTHNNNAAKEKNKSYLNVDTSSIGIKNAIIFRLGGVEKYEDGQLYTVTITGVKDIAGKPVTIQYDTNFFNLGDTNNMLKLSAEELILNVGDTSRLVAGLGSKVPVDPNGNSPDNILWQSYNTKVATIGKDGTINALQEGTCIIRAYSTNKMYSRTCVIRVVSDK